MSDQTILRPIGKGQITIPLAWRKKLGIDGVPVSARLEDGRVIIEPTERPEWDVRTVDFGELNALTKRTVEGAVEDWRAGRKEKFVSHDEFWRQVSCGR